MARKGVGRGSAELAPMGHCWVSGWRRGDTGGRQERIGEQGVARQNRVG